ncbi:MAG: hypothetical protein M5U07_16705, partial [Xanthobacteraceae bacterium]|nr:hypothetical protein [Xanthobacteraceae bacterium]
MAASKLTQLLGQGALKALANLGGTKPLAWALVFVLIAVVNTVIDQISDAVRSRVAGVDVLAPAVRGGGVGRLYWFAHKVKLEPRAEEEEARPVKVLILFLSQPGKLEDYADIEGTLGSPELGDRLGRLQWRMPIAAVAHHIGRLERLVVIGSPGEKGTNRLVGDFKKLLDRLLPPGKRLSIESSGIFLGRDDTGVDFENPQQLIEELGAIYRRLEDQRIRDV